MLKNWINKILLDLKHSKVILVNCERYMCGSRGGAGGPDPHLKNHKFIYGFLVILVRIP